MEKLKRNLIFARKSVFFNFKSYLWFFCALIVIQVYLSTFSLSSLNVPNAAKGLADSGYNYHLLLKNINADQYLLVDNGLRNSYSGIKFYEITEVYQYSETGTFDQRYDVYIKFKNDPDSSYKRFESYFSSLLDQYGAGTGWYEYKSPLLNVASDPNVSPLYFYGMLLLCFTIFVIFLGVMFSVRANYFKFSYGIFMTFGGGFKKIFSTSFWEMTIIALLAFVPSSVISYIIARVAYLSSGYAFSADFRAFPISLLISLSVSAVALYIPCKRISRKTPVDNLIAEDNSNYVTSPRLSSEFFRVPIPFKYEFLSLFRFRRYNLKLVITGALFCALFIWINQFAGLYSERFDQNYPDFTVTFAEQNQNSGEEDSAETDETDEVNYDTDAEVDSGEAEQQNNAQDGQDVKNHDYLYTDTIDDSVRSIEGIKCIEREVTALGPDTPAHIIIDSSLHDSKPDVIEVSEGDAVSNVAFKPFSEKEISFFEMFDYTGSLSDALLSNGIIVSDTVNNERHYSFEPGDKIIVGRMTEQTRYVPDRLSGKKLFERQLESYRYDYKEYTVAAVIHNLPSDEYLNVYIPENDYLLLAGVDEIACRNVRIWLDGSVDDAQSNNVEAKIASVIKPYHNASVTNYHNSALNSMERSANKYLVLKFSALIILIISCFSWLFSQRTFYLKRNDEFELLGVIGVPKRKVCGILLTDALFLGVISSAVFLVLSYVTSGLILTLANRFFSSNGIIRYTYICSPYLFIIGSAVILICSVVSSAAAYRVFYRKIKISDKININTEFD